MKPQHHTAEKSPIDTKIKAKIASKINYAYLHLPFKHRRRINRSCRVQCVDYIEK